MPDRNEHRIAGLYEEIAVRQADGMHVIDAAQELAEAKRQYECNYPGPELDAKLKRLLAHQRRKRTARHVVAAVVHFARRTVVVKTALVFLCLLAAFGMLFLTVEAFRVKVQNLFAQAEKQHVTIGVEVDRSDILAVGFVYMPAYTPEGFRMDVMETDAITKRMIFTNSTGDIYVFEQSVEKLLELDNEHISIPTTINGNEGEIIQNEDYSVLFWKQQGYFYLLSGHLEIDMLIKIAESVAPI